MKETLWATSMFSFNSPTPKYFTDRDMKKIIQKIEQDYPKPACQREDGCIYAEAMQYTCVKCIQWKVSQTIIETVRNYN